MIRFAPARPTAVHSIGMTLATALIPGLAAASGYALNEQSASAMGAANAGAAANVENATILFFNPAGMAFLPGTQTSFGGTILDVQTNFAGSATNDIGQPVNGSSGGDFVPLTFIPNAYLTQQLGDFAFGFGMSVPFGLKGKYDNDFVGRFFADRTEILMLDLQPSFAYKITDNIAIGVGLDALHANGRLSKSQDFSSVNPALGDGYFEVTGQDWGFGWNAGILLDFSHTSIGLTYRSKVDLDLKGTARLDGVPTLTGNPSNPLVYASLSERAALDLTTPESATISFKQTLTDQLKLLAGATWTRWSRFQNLDILSDESGGAISALAATKYGQANMIGHVPERWTNTWAFSLGVAYQFADSPWTLKAGYAFDQDPVPEQYRTARVPSTDRNWLTVGSHWQESPQSWAIDMAFGYLIMKDVNLDEYEYKVDDSRVAGAANVTGRYSLNAWGLALQLSKAF